MHERLFIKMAPLLFWGLVLAPSVAQGCAVFTQLTFTFNEPAQKGRSTVVDETTKNLYHVVDTSNEDFFISAEVVNGDLRLSFSTRVRDPHIKEHWNVSQLDAKEHFPKILKHFEGRFQRIVGEWKEGPMDYNLRTFNVATLTYPHEEAARRTWTGKLAVEHGYDKVSFDPPEGTPGNYVRVIVYFEKSD